MASQFAGVFGFRLCGVSASFLWWGLAGVLAQDSSWVEYRHVNGEVSSKGWLVDGIPGGYWVSFHEDGTRKSEGNWESGKLSGDWVFYDEKGRLETTLTYRNGEKQGEETHWDSTGTKLRVLPWDQDTLSGWEVEYHPDGWETRRIPWVSGQKEGVALEFAKGETGETRIIRRMGYRGDLLRWVEDINRFDDQNRKTGKWMSFWPNGRVREEGPFARGLKEGVFKLFNRNGDLERTETYKRGKRVVDAPTAVALDLRQSFHANGEIARSGPWREAIPMGIHRFFDDEGHLVEVKVFREGVLEASGMLDASGLRTGEWTLFWPDGTARAVGPYLEGEREGPWKFFNRMGRLEQEGDYRVGEWHGKWRWYHPDGKLHRQEYFRKGREDGEFLELSSRGDTVAIGSYERGLKQGEWFEIVDEDRQRGAYLDGERDGLWRHVEENGNVLFIGAYSAGVPTGEHSTYWPSGIRASVGSHEGGLKNGNWRYFDAQGVIRLIRQYENGRIVKVNGVRTDRK